MPWDGDKNTYLNNMRDGKLPVYSRRSKLDGCCPACVFGPGSKYAPNEHAAWCETRRTVSPVVFERLEVKL